MPNFLFASNNLSQFPAAQINTDESNFDPNRVPYGLTLAQDNTQASCLPFPRSQTTETWIHFRYATDITYNNINGNILFVRDDINAVDVLRLEKISNGNPFARLYLTDGVSTDSELVTASLPSNSNISIDIKLEILLTETKATMYINGSQVCVASLQVNQGNILHPNVIRLCGGGRYTTSFPTFSEIIVADGDTRNMRLNMLRPIIPGIYDDWQGSILNLADDDNTSGVLSSTPGDKLSYVLNAYGGSNIISGVISVTTGSHGLNGPENIKHFLRKTGVDYKSLDLPVGDTLSTQVQNWILNPATSAPWTQQDLSAIEFGLESMP